MYPNLEAELARKRINRNSLAKIIHKTPTTLSLKLNGKAPITLNECIEIKRAIDTDCSIEHLFATDEAAEERGRRDERKFN